jgi:hypothetical protein
VVEDFVTWVGGELTAKPVRDNLALDPFILKLYKTIPGIRQAHNSEIDRVFRPLLKSGNQTPWIVSQRFAEKIIEETYADNIALLELMKPDQRRRMSEDRRWWDAAACNDRFERSTDDGTLNREEAVEIVRSIVPALISRTGNIHLGAAASTEVVPAEVEVEIDVKDPATVTSLGDANDEAAVAGAVKVQGGGDAET